jgi:hypothetical protein
MNAAVPAVTGLIGVYDCVRSLEDGDVFRRKVVLAGTFDDESFVPGVRAERRIDVSLFRPIHKDGMEITVHVNDSDPFFGVAMAEAFVSVQLDPFCRINLEDYSPNEIFPLTREVGVCFSGAVLITPLVKTQRVIQEFGDPHRISRGDTVSQASRAHVGAVGEVEHGTIVAQLTSRKDKEKLRKR